MPWSNGLSPAPREHYYEITRERLYRPGIGRGCPPTWFVLESHGGLVRFIASGALRSDLGSHGFLVVVLLDRRTPKTNPQPLSPQELRGSPAVLSRRRADQKEMKRKESTWVTGPG